MGSARRPTFRTVLTVVVVAATAAASAPPVPAAGDATERRAAAAQPVELASGSYVGTLSGAGTLSGSAQGGSFSVDFVQNGSVDFGVEAGVASGSWQSAGFKHLTVQTPRGPFVQIADESSSGTVGGDGSVLVLDGLFDPEVRSATLAGRPVPNVDAGPTPVEPPMRVTIVYADCGRARGDWVQERTAEAAELGLDLEATGGLDAVRVGESAVADAVKAQLEGLLTEAQGYLVSVATSGPDALDPWALVGLMQRAEALLSLVSPTDLECEFPGFVHLLRHFVRELLEAALDDPGALSVRQIVHLLSAGVRTGALDPANGADGTLVARMRLELERRVAEGDPQEACSAAVALGQFGLIGSTLDAGAVVSC